MTEWYWMRVFSVFGERENSNWLIPTVIHRLLNKEPIQLSSCEQRYNYLYIEDFVNLFLSAVRSKEDKSGIYNICHSNSIVLKDLLLEIADLIDVPHNLLQFGSIPQILGQNM